MGLPVLVLGYSGSGKSASLRNFKANELALVNVNGKSLPFRTKFTSSINSDNYIDIEDFIKKQKCKSIAVDDAQYLMANEYMRRAKETGFQKFTDIGKNFWELVKDSRMTRLFIFSAILKPTKTADRKPKQSANCLTKKSRSRECLPRF